MLAREATIPPSISMSIVPMAAAPGAPAHDDAMEGATSTDLATQPGPGAQAGVTAASFDIYMPQFNPVAFPPFVVGGNDFPTVGHFKEHVIQLVCSKTGVYLRQQHAIFSDRSTTMPLPYNMPWSSLLDLGRPRALNLWLHSWTDSHRYATRYQAGLTAAPRPFVHAGMIAPPDESAERPAKLMRLSNEPSN